MSRSTKERFTPGAILWLVIMDIGAICLIALFILRSCGR